MSSRWFWVAAQVSRRIWVRASLYSLLAVVTALLGIVASPYIPSELPTKVGAAAVDNILGIIASSMLTVTTFSLSVMVSAYSSATSNVTPRATRLVMEDSTTQNVLSTFVGSFLFSLVGIIVLSTGAYGEQGRVVLFGATIGVIVLIVVTLLRWIDHLSRLGRLTETTALVEGAAIKAMRERHQNPYIGGSQLVDPATDIPGTATTIHTSQIGYIQHVDIGGLSKLVGEQPGAIYLIATPGDFVDPTEPIAWAFGVSLPDPEQAVRACFSIGDTRSFDQDPRFGASVLAEIGSRALSSGINDLGTVIDIIGRMVRVMAIWAEPREDLAPRFPKVFVPAIKVGDLFDDLFTPIAQDGAGSVEVGLRLQKALAALARLDERQFGSHALRHSQEAVVRSKHAMIELDYSRIVEAARKVPGAASH